MATISLPSRNNKERKLTMNEMLGNLVVQLVALSNDVLTVLWDLVQKLRGHNGGEWLSQLKKFLRKETCWVEKKKELIYLYQLYRGKEIKLGDLLFSVHEITANCTFTQLLGSLGDLNQIALNSFEQVKEFCYNHGDELRMAIGYKSLFLFLYKEGQHFFIADVFISNDGRISWQEYPLGCSRIWVREDRYRVVTVQS